MPTEKAKAYLSLHMANRSPERTSDSREEIWLSNSQVWQPTPLRTYKRIFPLSCKGQMMFPIWSSNRYNQILVTKSKNSEILTQIFASCQRKGIVKILMCSSINIACLTTDTFTIEVCFTVEVCNFYLTTVNTPRRMTIIFRNSFCNCPHII